MKQNRFFNFGIVWANDVDALIPELWAQEALYQARSTMVAANLIHRDYEPLVAEQGDVVNAHRPAAFSAKRKSANDNVTTQNATVTKVQVPVDQLLHVSFVIRDAQRAWAFPDLVSYFLKPAMIAEAEFVDSVILGQYKHFLANQVGKLGDFSSTTARGYITDLGTKATNLKMPSVGRNLIWTPSSAGEAKKAESLLNANTRGDGGNALQNASLGYLLGFGHYECQNMASSTVAASDNGLINNAGGYAAGTTAITCDTFSGQLLANSWVTVDGKVYRVQANTATPAVAVSLVSPGLQASVADNAVCTAYASGAVNLGAGYAAGYAGEIALDGFTDATDFPKKGQLLTFGTDPTSTVYTVIESTHTGSGAGTVTLDIPLAAMIADNAGAHSGPGGNFNLGFVREAVGMVVRDLPVVNDLARGAIVRDAESGLSMRVTITYDGEAQGYRVTIDMLYGIQLFDEDLGAILLG